MKKTEIEIGLVYSETEWNALYFILIKRTFLKDEQIHELTQLILAMKIQCGSSMKEIAIRKLSQWNDIKSCLKSMHENEKKYFGNIEASIYEKIIYDIEELWERIK